MRTDPATRRIAAFERRRGEAHLMLACHCAVPLALTPDLAYRLWANFQRDVEGRPLSIPWVAVADLLLSRLCEEVGDELYEMDGTIRQQLLGRLEQDPRFGARRIGEVAEFLLQYVKQQVRSEDLDTRDFALAQEWNALAYIRPDVAAHELALALTAVDRRDTPELLRITSVVDTLSKPLESFGSLLVYADALHGFARGNRSAAADLLGTLVDEDSQIHIAGATMTISRDLLSPAAERPPQPAGKRPAHSVRKRWALLVDVHHRNDPPQPSPRSAGGDTLALQQTLNDLGVTTVALHNDATEDYLLPTQANIQAELARLALAAEPDDLLLFFFSGHVLQSGSDSLLGVQYSRSSPTLTMITTHEIGDALRQARARDIVIILDNSGTQEKTDPLATESWEEFGTRVDPSAERRLAVLAATGGRQGLFVDHLRAGLAGDADRSGHGYVTMRDLCTYVEERQAELGPDRGVLSYVWRTADIPLVEVPGRAAPPAGIADPTQAIGSAGADDVSSQAAEAPSTSVAGEQAAALREPEPQGPVSVPLSVRVVEIIADLGDGVTPRYRYGSGCLVAGRTVLTAAHVVAGAARVVVRDPVKVVHEATLDPRFAGDVDGPAPDLALVELATPGINVSAMGVAAVDRESPAGEPVERCHVVGYPAFSEQPAADGGLIRDAVDVFGIVPTLSGVAGGLLSVQVSVSPQPLPPAGVRLGESQWSGMSGAPVVANGQLLGVVTELAPRQSDSAITATPLTALEADPAHPAWGSGVANPGAWWARLGVSGADALQRLPTPRRRAQPAYWHTIRAMRQRTPVLVGRQRELADIATFATGSEGYRWLVGAPWSGKTSLLAEAVMVLQDQCDVVSYFLSRRQADADSSRFLAAVVPQLAYLLDEDPPLPELHQFRALWERAAQQADAEGRHLLLVVDGLDEDLHPPGQPSVASLLPAVGRGHAHVLVSSRPHPALPVDLPPGHPLARTQPVPLEPSRAARALAQLARQELDDLLRRSDDGLTVDVLGLLTAAAGPLTVNDLAALSGVGPPSAGLTRRIRRLVSGEAARSLQAVGSTDSPRYQFAQSSLLIQAQDNEDLSDPEFRHRIERWADQWRDAGWPEPGGKAGTTPQYLLDSYPSTLGNQPTRLAAVVGDVGWVSAAVQTVGVDATLAMLDAAQSAGAASAEVLALLATLRALAADLRPPRPIDQPGYVLRRLATQAAELGEDRLAAAAQARLQASPEHQVARESLAPVVTGVSPVSGLAGEYVTVTGSGFTGATGVNFGQVASPDLSVSSDSQLVAAAPPGVAGMVHVTVTTPAGTSATTPADHFTCMPAAAPPPDDSESLAADSVRNRLFRSERSRRSTPTTNPFVLYGTIASDDRFVGRSRERAVVQRRLYQARSSAALIGLTRMGKSSLANQILRDAPDERTLTGWVNIATVRSGAEVLQDILALCPPEAPLHATFTTAGSFPAGGDVRDTHEVPLHDLYRMIREALLRLGRSGGHLVVVLDEFDSIKLFPDARDFLNLLRELVYYPDRIPMAVLAVARRPIDRIEVDAADVSSFGGVCDSVYLRPMAYEDIQAMAARSPELPTDAPVVAWKYAAGHPFLSEVVFCRILEHGTTDIGRIIQPDLSSYYKKLEDFLRREELWEPLQKMASGRVIEVDVEQGALVRRYGLIDENGEVWSPDFSAYLQSRHQR